MSEEDETSEIEVPRVIKQTLMDGEEVLHFIQQSRLKKMVTPESIFVTNKRVIKHIPRALGLMRNIQDYKYVDMANTEIKQGLLFSNIKIKMRFNTEPVSLEMIPNSVVRKVFATIQKGIENRLVRPIPETFLEPPLTQTFVEDEDLKESEIESEPEPTPEKEEDLLTILQRRYVTGEITKKEYLDMKKELVPTVPKKPKKKRKKKKKVKKRTSKRKKKKT